MVEYLLDTNHASRLMSQDRRVLSHVRQAETSGDTLGVSMTVVGELYFAVHASRRHVQNLQRLQQLLATLHIYPFEQADAEEFGRIQAEQKAKGRPIPPLDAQIAAVARRRGLTVLTADKHFGYVDGIPTQNWLDE
ncbi:MAG: PIN domain-containing protein [Chloroflexota bacterium]|nr:PIN domain-containing protein [Chloroflexota bacterium]